MAYISLIFNIKFEHNGQYIGNHTFLSIIRHFLRISPWLLAIYFIAQVSVAFIYTSIAAREAIRR